MSRLMSTRMRIFIAIGAIALIGLLVACGGRTPAVPGEPPMATGDVQKAALATYVKPGDLDTYYLFYSGRHSGQVFVAGVPSMRHVATIPVFTPYPGTGYGFDLQIAGTGQPGPWLAALLSLNPIDGMRAVTLVELGADVLLGPTAAALQRIFGANAGLAMVMGSLIVWLIAPMAIAARCYARRDF